MNEEPMSEEEEKSIKELTEVVGKLLSIVDRIDKDKYPLNPWSEEKMEAYHAKDWPRFFSL